MVCLFVAKFSKWVLYTKKMNYRCSANDFYMFSKSFSFSINDFHVFIKWFSYSEHEFNMFHKWFFYSAKTTFTFNKKFIYSAVLNLCSVTWGFIFNSLKFVFNKMKFIKLKSFTFSKPNLDVTKYTSKSIRQNKRSGL